MTAQESGDMLKYELVLKQKRGEEACYAPRLCSRSGYVVY